ncbi:hypothetical protein NADFUDRAFT_68253 [Nadsonia fulvescens var. elongata DSM 6958]|uniref:Cytochrome c oxidase subunit 8, mitochondrial n=1 Tax=Nadsonia fulvescens var. elongata DSM 6958 TaxID=857566 RepID=A0A1E3PRG2_9ASCO|nr:hypothetical protein NADFUDRAFT_68253 [Nadsonia fulvescens var. elongata DSM 6958]
MLSRSVIRAAKPVSKRGFTSSAVRPAHFPEGPYNNLPFKVHNRKIPYPIVHWSFFAIGFGLPFGIAYFHIKKSS